MHAENKFAQAVKAFTAGIKDIEAKKEQVTEGATSTVPRKAYDPDTVLHLLYANRAMSSIQLLRFDNAIEDCTAALSVDPTYVKALYRRAGAFEKAGRASDAVCDWKKLMRDFEAFKADTEILQKISDLERQMKAVKVTNRTLEALKVMRFSSDRSEEEAVATKLKEILVLDDYKACLDHSVPLFTRPAVKLPNQEPLDEQECRQWTLLHEAVGIESLAAVKCLISLGAKLNPKDADGETPLFIATGADVLEIMQALLEAGADPNVVSNDNTSPVVLCAQRSLSDALELLLASGASPTIGRDMFGQGPLAIVRREDAPIWTRGANDTTEKARERRKRCQMLLEAAINKPNKTAVKKNSELSCTCGTCIGGILSTAAMEADGCTQDLENFKNMREAKPIRDLFGALTVQHMFRTMNKKVSGNFLDGLKGVCKTIAWSLGCHEWMMQSIPQVQLPTAAFIEAEVGNTATSQLGGSRSGFDAFKSEGGGVIAVIDVLIRLAKDYLQDGLVCGDDDEVFRKLPKCNRDFRWKELADTIC